MPPKVKFTKDEIIQAALNVARVKGASSVSTRDIAAELQVSTRPIFTYFDTMDEVRAEIRKAAEVVYERYVQRGLAEPIPFLGVGMEYIRFAREEPQLYRLLFLTQDAEFSAMRAMAHLQEACKLLGYGILRCLKKRHCLSAASSPFFQAPLAKSQNLRVSWPPKPRHPGGTSPTRRRARDLVLVKM